MSSTIQSYSISRLGPHLGLLLYRDSVGLSTTDAPLDVPFCAAHSG